jgi:hypothetical protein
VIAAYFHLHTRQNLLNIFTLPHLGVISRILGLDLLNYPV